MFHLHILQITLYLSVNVIHYNALTICTTEFIPCIQNSDKENEFLLGKICRVPTVTSQRCHMSLCQKCCLHEYG